MARCGHGHQLVLRDQASYTVSSDTCTVRDMLGSLSVRMLHVSGSCPFMPDSMRRSYLAACCLR